MGIINVSCKVPFRCPVCGGNGLVAGSFYIKSGETWTAANSTETCRSCNGTGIVWSDGLGIDNVCIPSIFSPEKQGTTGNLTTTSGSAVYIPDDLA
jgi:hypothetical protein